MNTLRPGLALDEPDSPTPPCADEPRAVVAPAAEGNGLLRLPWLEARPVLITGGAGFLGANLANRLLEAGETVLLFDNLSRREIAKNVAWLRRAHGDRVELAIADVRDRGAVEDAVRRASIVFHFAAQVTMRSSLADPRSDFLVNAGGTINVLEAARQCAHRPPVVYASSSEVYGALPDIVLRRAPGRYEPSDGSIRLTGVSEARALDFQGPHGCSKGAADQYVLDYARTYGLDAVALRLSCVYGPHQFGTEDQGFVAHCLQRAIVGEPIPVHGSGMQVRDALFVDDLVDALLLVRREMRRVSGQAFNIGGGPGNTVSVLELVEIIEGLLGQRPELRDAPPRPGDRRYYVSDFRRLAALTGWTPRVRVRDGVRRLHEWLGEQAPRTSSVNIVEASS